VRTLLGPTVPCATALVVLLMAGCTTDADPTDPARPDAVQVEPDDEEADVPDDATANDGATDDTTTDGHTVDDARDGASADTDGAAPSTALELGDLVDLTRPEPGAWPVGDAGVVEFDLRDGDLVLLGVVAAEGWAVSIEEDDTDELEVAFTRGQERWRLEAELDDELDLQIAYDHPDAPHGAHSIGDAGSFALGVSGDRLELTRLDVADGWQLIERDEDDDGFELELRRDERRFQVEVELNDGRAELVIHYSPRGRPVT
jgi:hypothetical protein